jgi:hypothetical protein
MPAILSIQIDPEERENLARVLNPKQLKQAQFQAVKRTTNKVVGLVQKAVKDRSFIKPKYIKRVIAKRDPRGDPPVGEVVVTKKRLPLIAFKVRASKKNGVTAQVSKGAAPIVLRHAFVATVRTKGTDEEHDGHKGVFQRDRHLPTKGPNAGKGKLTARGFAGRFAIKEQFGRSVFDVVNVKAVVDGIVFDAGAEMSRQLQGQLARFTKPKGSPPAPPESAADTQ